MSRIVTRSLLDDLCGQPEPGKGPLAAVRAVAGLGQLATWWLRPEVLNRAGIPGPATGGLPCLPTNLGSSWVVFVNKNKERWPLLRSALVLPLSWKKDAPPDDCLPTSLRSLAERVLAQFRERGAVTGSWQLHRSCEARLDECDLSRLSGDDLAADSGWVPLAGSLLIADKGILPRREVWASGDWTEIGIDRVTGLEAKLDLAHEFKVESFFVPRIVAPEVRQWQRANPDSSFRIGYLASLEENPVKALQPYLAELGHPPALAQNFAVRKDYYLLQGTGSIRGESYYWDNLLPTIIERLQSQVRKEWSSWRPEYFVTIVSFGHELVPLGVQVAGARRCLLLYTKDAEGQIEKRLQRVRTVLARQGIECLHREFTEGTRAELADQFRQLVSDFLPAGTSPEAVGFDITPGKKLMSLALADIAPEGSGMIYLDHAFRLDRRAEPGSETLQLWRVGAPTQRVRLPREATPILGEGWQQSV